MNKEQISKSSIPVFSGHAILKDIIVELLKKFSIYFLCVHVHFVHEYFMHNIQENHLVSCFYLNWKM
jgi:hypothetical protein